jgi:hypothetical protein
VSDPAPGGATQGTTVTDKRPAGRPLDDVMIAMDVVDTLRHDMRIVERELNDETRRAELIERLRNLYKSQGIDVPDHIFEEGVRALEEKRFVYTPPESNLAVRLARLYVSREAWGKRAAGIGAAAALASSGWYLAIERPRAIEQDTIQRELGEALPARVTGLMSQIEREARNPDVVSRARQISETARSAATGRQLEAARVAERQLATMLDELRRAYDIRIVNREGEITGLWRVPRVNPLSRNYYLVVEAIDASGKAVPRDVLNEETGKRETVTRWAVRVPKTVFDQVQSDKLDDGIIQNAVLGTKRAGELEPKWRQEVSGGALTRW